MEKIPFRMFGMYDKDLKINSDVSAYIHAGGGGHCRGSVYIGVVLISFSFSHFRN